MLDILDRDRKVRGLAALWRNVVITLSPFPQTIVKIKNKVKEFQIGNLNIVTWLPFNRVCSVVYCRTCWRNSSTEDSSRNLSQPCPRLLIKSHQRTGLQLCVSLDLNKSCKTRPYCSGKLGERISCQCRRKIYNDEINKNCVTNWKKSIKHTSWAGKAFSTGVGP